MELMGNFKNGFETEIGYSLQQRMVVVYGGGEDDISRPITIVKDNDTVVTSHVMQNEYNTSARRHSSVIYFVSEEANYFKEHPEEGITSDGLYYKLAISQHKGTEYLKAVPCKEKEFNFFFDRS